MAGVPPLNGFLSKELMLENAAHADWLTPWLVARLATAGALLSVAYSLRFLAHTFMGTPREDHPTRMTPASASGPHRRLLVAHRHRLGPVADGHLRPLCRCRRLCHHRRR